CVWGPRPHMSGAAADEGLQPGCCASWLRRSVFPRPAPLSGSGVRASRAWWIVAFGGRARPWRAPRRMEGCKQAGVQPGCDGLFRRYEVQAFRGGGGAGPPLVVHRDAPEAPAESLLDRAAGEGDLADVLRVQDIAVAARALEDAQDPVDSAVAALL